MPKREEPKTLLEQAADRSIDRKYRSRRGRGGVQDDAKRIHTVSVRLDAEELEALNAARKMGASPVSRGEYLRMCFVSPAELRLRGTYEDERDAPRPVPELNRQAYSELARAAANLNQIAHKLNAASVGEITQQRAAEIRSELEAFRAELLSAGLSFKRSK